MPHLQFECVSAAGTEQRTFHARELVLAGWTGRDPAAIQHHIEELAAIGVAPPSRTPIYYRCGVQVVTQTDRLQVLGGDTSGEVEYVLVAFEDGLWVTVGSDQTDRKQEGVVGVALSKQLAGKVLARTCWKLDEIIGHWDDIAIEAKAVIGGQLVPYQSAKLGHILRPEILVLGAGEDLGTAGKLPPGTVLMSGTPPAIGGVRPGSRFEMSLTDPVTGRSITHAYDIDALPVVA